MDIDRIEKSFFKTGNPLKKLLGAALDLLTADQVGILYGTNSSGARFLPTNEWDRGVADMFDGRGSRGKILKYLGRTLVFVKGLSPVFFYKTDARGRRKDNDGLISYMLRTCADYYEQGIHVVFSPVIPKEVDLTDAQYVSIPLYTYNGNLIRRPDNGLNVDLHIIRHFQAKNFVSVYIPDYGILVANTVTPGLLARDRGRFLKEGELKKKFDLLTHLVEVASLAVLGRLKGRRSTYLLRKKEKQLRQTSRSLIENERKYVDLYENAPVAYFSLDYRGTIIKCNQATGRLSGYEKRELIGHNILDFYAPEPEEKMTKEQVVSILDRNRTVKDLEMKFKNKKGQGVWVTLCLDILKNAEGKVLEFRVMAVDISKRKRLEAQLLQTQKMEAIGTLAGGIAHDFNNILTPISGYSEILSMNNSFTREDHKKYLYIIQNCAAYAKGLVNQMLTFSKQKETKISLVAPHLFVEEALGLVRAFLPSAIKIKKRISRNCGMLLADPVQVQQIVMNLMTNACHAMNENGGVLTVSLETVEIQSRHEPGWMPGRYCCLTVEDTGAGIPDHIVNRIFDPFFTTKRQGSSSGIGLSVVREIVRSHSGYIRVSSAQKKGTVFRVYLPVDAGGQAIETPDTDNILICRGDERILLVDDDVKVLDMMTHMLKGLGYRVTPCSSSLNALERCRRCPDAFDLIITDLTMPDLTGDQLSESVCRVRPDLPIIIYTGFGELREKKMNGLRAVKGILNKPLTVKEVSCMIRRVLDGKTAV